MKCNLSFNLIRIIIIPTCMLLLSCSNEIETLSDENDFSSAIEEISLSRKISIQEAQADLETLLLDIDGLDITRAGTIRRIENACSLPVNNAETRSEESDTIWMHIFNFEKNQGYAIMSGDRNFPSLIALANQGALLADSEIDNPGLALFLEGISNEFSDNPPSNNETIKPVPNQDDETYSGSGYTKYGPWQNIVYKQNGYCPVKWGQKGIYNDYCPIKDGRDIATGCVATALAQLMTIYRYPSSYNGYTFSWDEMTYHPLGNYCSSTGRDNIARLMQQLGLPNNLDMEYGEESGCNPENITRTLLAFGYSNGGTLRDYETKQVIDDLKQGYPVLAGGQSFKHVTKLLGITVRTSYSGGHRWLMHGLLERRREVKKYSAGHELLNTYIEYQWYPLCNWGYEGDKDGYYLSTSFDINQGCRFPESETSTRSDEETTGKDYNFQFKLTAVTGIRK